MSDLARVIAFAFRRKGAQTLPGGDLRLMLAYDLRWFAPEDAKRVVARALESGLLRDDGGVLAPAFDLAAIEVPVNFRPSLAVLEEAIAALAPAPAPPAAPAPAPAPGHEPAVEAERRKRGLLVSAEVALLIVERRSGADVTAKAAELEAALLRG